MALPNDSLALREHSKVLQGGPGALDSSCTGLCKPPFRSFPGSK